MIASRSVRRLLLSAIVVLFIAGSAEAATYTVSNYSQLRQQSCSVGETAEIQSGRYAGQFDCVASSQAWRKPFSDDGGIQFSSGTGGNIWKRSFGYSQSEPIQLQWYESVQPGDRIDLLIGELTNDFSPNVYLKAPSVAGSYNWPSDLDLSGKTKQFYFIESAAKTTFDKAGVSGGGASAVSFLRNDGGDVVVVGGPSLNMTFAGPASADRPQSEPSSGSTSRPGTEDALTFYGCGEDGGTHSTLTVRINVRHPLGGSVGVSNSGCSQARDWQNVTLGGVYEAAFRANEGFTHVHLDNLIVQDPWGRRWGWTGGAYPNNNSGGYKVGGTARVQKGGKLTGELTLQYGIKMFWAKLDQIGNSEADPFVIHYRDNCYSGPNTSRPGERISTNGTNGNISKMDDLGTTGKYWYYLDQEGTTYGNGCGNTFFDFESSKNGGASNSGVTLTSSGLSGGGPVIIDTAICQGGDRDDNHTIKGGPQPNGGQVRMVDTVTLTEGTFDDVLVTKDTCSGSGDNTIKKVTLTGSVSLTSSVRNTTFDNVTFTGSKRQVINVGSGSNAIITSGRIKAPVGSTIGGSGTLTCSGSSQSLPFTFDGTADNCETTTGAPPPPPPAESITVTSPNGGESWQAGSTHAITWNDNISGSVKIDLVQGGSASTIVASTASDGSYNWTIPAQQAEASNYRVRITSTGDGNVSDESGANFTIVGAPPPPPSDITVSSPNGGESWQAGTTHAITWDDNIGDNVKIDLVQGTSVSTIVASTASDGSYNWAIPALQEAATNYRVRITSTGDASVTDQSNANFTIAGLPPPPTVDQDVELDSGWNLMSVNVEPVDTKVENVVADISDQMILLKDNSGRLYYPEFNINTIGDWDIHEGYQINVVEPVTLTVDGQAVLDPSMPIDLEEGWNLIPFVPSVDLPVATALESIIDNLVIVLNNAGDVYYPQLGIDEIGTLKSGQGYRIYVDQAVTLVYNPPG